MCGMGECGEEKMVCGWIDGGEGKGMGKGEGTEMGGWR